MPERPFCVRIAAGEYEDRHQWAVTFEPLNEVTSGYRLVVPTCHVRSALSDHVVSGATMEFAVPLAKNLGVEQCKPITSARAAATQTGEHSPIPMVPRGEDDGRQLPWTGQVRQEVAR